MNAPAEKFVADMKVVADDVRELIALTADQSAEKVVNARAKAKAALAGMEEKLALARAAAADQARRVVTTTDEYVHGSPWRSIGVAAGVGLLVGFLLGRR